MYKLIFLLSGLFLLACNNQSATTESKKDSAAALTAAGDTSQTGMDRNALEFLAPCVDNAKVRLGEQQAYVLCKCIYGQVQQKYPNADSATLLSHLSDTTEVAQMARNCK
ncbi:hypothetical protein [Flavisolibacter nicotianae]|uniref:hypothetical protein n=1 Tax=Flavisolibacter nicotianae TaxID=2364882 RepID=UPI0013C4DFE4|nr:hypothetical protein [Flavisolibacter nicotianae]